MTGRIVSELAPPAEQAENGNGITVAVDAFGANTRKPAAVTGWHSRPGIAPVSTMPSAALTVAAPLERDGLELGPRDPARGATELLAAQRHGRHARVAAQRAGGAEVRELQLEEDRPGGPFGVVSSQLTSCEAVHGGNAAACAAP